LNFWKSFKPIDPQTKVLREANSKGFVILNCTVLIQSQSVTDDGQTDKWTDVSTITKSHYSTCCREQKSPNSIMPTFTETSPRGKSWTQIMKVCDTNHVANFHDLCPRLSPWGSFGESWHNGIWAEDDNSDRLRCVKRKVSAGVMQRMPKLSSGEWQDIKASDTRAGYPSRTYEPL